MPRAYAAGPRRPNPASWTDRRLQGAATSNRARALVSVKRHIPHKRDLVGRERRCLAVAGHQGPAGELMRKHITTAFVRAPERRSVESGGTESGSRATAWTAGACTA